MWYRVSNFIVCLVSKSYEEQEIVEADEDLDPVKKDELRQPTDPLFGNLMGSQFYRQESSVTQ